MRVAVVGLGLMGMLHSRILLTERDVTSVVGIEINRERACKASIDLNIPILPSLRDVLDEVDAVSITLPDDLHVDAAVCALQAGKYVFVEKPLATTSAECMVILDAQSAPGRLMVGHVLRFDERLRELKRRLDSGSLGKLRYVKIHRSNSTAGGQRVGQRVSVTAFLGVHDLDLLLWLTSQEIVDVQASGRRVFGKSWDVSVASLSMSGGTLAQVENHWLLHSASARSALAGIQIFGDEGTALIDLSTAELELVTDADPRSVRIDTRNWTHDADVSGGALRREINSFVRAAHDGSPVEITGEEGYRAVHAVELVERAIRSSSDNVSAERSLESGTQSIDR